MKPNHFIEKYLPYAKKNEADTGVPALVTLSQAALESGWGSHAPGNNFFGIKAGKSWTGEVQNLMTTEFEGDKEISIPQKFRKYESPLDSFRDHAVLLKKRFPNAFKYTDPVQFINAVQNEHEYKYATDPDYLRKMSTLIYTIMDEIKRNGIKEDFSDLEPKGLETIPSKKKENNLEMEKVKMPNESVIPYGIQETTDVVGFLTSAANAVQESLHDDGKITIRDYPKFFGTGMKLFPALTGIGLVPKELNDLQPAEKAQLVEQIKNELGLSGNVEAIVSKALDIAYEIKQLADLIKQAK